MFEVSGSKKFFLQQEHLAQLGGGERTRPLTSSYYYEGPEFMIGLNME